MKELLQQSAGGQACEQQEERALQTPGLPLTVIVVQAPFILSTTARFPSAAHMLLATAQRGRSEESRTGEETEAHKPVRGSDHLRGRLPGLPMCGMRVVMSAQWACLRM